MREFIIWDRAATRIVGYLTQDEIDTVGILQAAGHLIEEVYPQESEV